MTTLQVLINPDTGDIGLRVSDEDGLLLELAGITPDAARTLIESIEEALEAGKPLRAKSTGVLS